MTTTFSGFSPTLTRFLKQLEANNDRAWFAEHKPRYEELVLTPALEFISAMAEPLAEFAPAFVARPKRVGGSLMRVYRDTRFSKDKSPYKTNVGIQFRHELGKDVHAPGFYLHIDPHRAFLGAGAWRPASPALSAIRLFISDNPRGWTRAKGAIEKAGFSFAGESLKRPPRGFDPSHPAIEDLKRKDFIAIMDFDHDALYRDDVVTFVADSLRATAPLMRFLCSAVDVHF